jgi:hypothetical protein
LILRINQEQIKIGEGIAAIYFRMCCPIKLKIKTYTAIMFPLVSWGRKIGLSHGGKNIHWGVTG